MLRVLFSPIEVSQLNNHKCHPLTPRSIFNTPGCASSDLSLLGIPQYVANTQQLVGNSADHCAILNSGDQNTCFNTYGTYAFAGDEVFNPLSLPDGVPGSSPLTNNPGNAFTEFGAGAFTLALFPGYSSTITPVPFDAKAGAPTGTLSGSDVATETGITAGASATGSASVGSSGVGGATSGSAAKSGATATKASVSSTTNTAASAIATTSKSTASRMGRPDNILFWGLVTGLLAVVLFR